MARYPVSEVAAKGHARKKFCLCFMWYALDDVNW